MNHQNRKAKSPAETSMLGALGMQAVSKYANVIVQLLVTMVLSRLLSPEQFGTVAIVTVFLSFFNILADLGISTAIVQYKELGQDDYNGIFFFSLLLGVILALVFVVLGLPISVIYQDGEIAKLCAASSPAVLFATMNMVPNGLLLQRKAFKSISIRLVVASLGSGLLAVWLAVASAGCYALVAQSVSNAAIVFIWNWISTRPRLSNPHFLAPLRKILRFSAYQGGFSIVNYYARNLDNILVGAILGNVALGYYDKAYKLMQYPINYLPGIFSSVLQPYLSDYKDDSERVYECWLGICRAIAIVGFAVAAVFVAFPDEIVFVMYGNQWGAAAPALKTLALSLGVQMVNSTSGAVFQSMGHTDLLFRSGLLCTAISLVAIILGVQSNDLATLGMCISGAYFVHLCVTALLLVGKVFRKSPIEFMGQFLCPMAAMALSAATALLLRSVLANMSVAVSVVVRFATGAAVYIIVCVATKQFAAFKVFAAMKSMRGRA